MGTANPQPWSVGVWDLVGRQHGVVTRAQLLEFGLGAAAIRQRLDNGRLHPLTRGVYAVGRPTLSLRGRWMAAVLACGPSALLSHCSAAALWGLRQKVDEPIEVVIPGHLSRWRPGIRVHRQRGLDASSRRVVDGIPVTDPISTLVDLATCVSTERLADAVNEADHRDLADPEGILTALGSFPRRPGVRQLRDLLTAPTFAPTGSELERRFLRLVHAAGLPLPQTQVWLNGYRVDFYWPKLGLVVEVDSLRYHRTPLHQKTDHRRDQAHVSSGLVALRFTGGQVRDEPA